MKVSPEPPAEKRLEKTSYYYENYPGAYLPTLAEQTSPMTPYPTEDMVPEDSFRRGGWSQVQVVDNFLHGSSSLKKDEKSIGNEPSIGSFSTNFQNFRSLCRANPQAGNQFRQVKSRIRLKNRYVRRRETVSSLKDCEDLCRREKAFYCRSFNFIDRFIPSMPINCELSDRNVLGADLSKRAVFEMSKMHDLYARHSKPGFQFPEECFEVAQKCTTKGMEFVLKTPANFRGKVYTHKHVDDPNCYLKGDGKETQYVLSIPGPNPTNGPVCGTQHYGNTQTNIVVVQYSQLVQTRADMLFNLTCTIQPPEDTLVTSDYIGSDGGMPMPIQYLPAEHRIKADMKLIIQYQGHPTDTIAIGDSLDFRLIPRGSDPFQADVLATDVIAKDPYTQRSVELIDSRGCPVDSVVFPALKRANDGRGLYTMFNAFKIPNSNFLVFEAKVKVCRTSCPLVVCDEQEGVTRRKRNNLTNVRQSKSLQGRGQEVFDLKEMFRVFDSRDEILRERAEKRIGPTTDASFTARPTGVHSGSDEDFERRNGGYCMTRLHFKAIIAALGISGVLGFCALCISCFYCHRGKSNRRLHEYVVDRTRLMRLPRHQQSHFDNSSVSENFSFGGTNRPSRRPF